MKFTLIPISLFIFFFTSLTNAYEQERIKSFDSRIVVQEDGSMLVTETIKVHSEGINIKHGIYRDFPTDYKDDYGNNFRIKFDVIDVLRDGSSEDYHTERLSNGIRVYFGKSNYLLPHGDYTYQITYKTDRELGYFKNYDELYWNVTGNGWDFNIDKVSAEVILPEGIDFNKVNFFGFTGREGSKAKDYIGEITGNKQIKFITTRRLFSKEGLTIVVQFPKGFVKEPDFQDKINYFIGDNKSVIAIFIGIIVLLLFYFVVWVKVGKDPEKGIIFPLYKTPSNLSPASVRFINRMGFDNKTFAAALIDLCVKGILKLEEDGKNYKVIKVKDVSTVSVTKDEVKLLSKLGFTTGGYGKTLELKQKNHQKIRSAITAFKGTLKNAYEKIYFITNRKYFVSGIIISLIFLLIAALFSNEDLLFMLIWNLIWSGGVSALLYTVFKSWRTALAGRVKGAALVSAIFITLFAIPFVGGLVLGMYFLSQAGSYLLIIGIVLIMLINIVFHHLLKAPTRLGRKIMDQIEGFKMYLSVAEKDRLNQIKEPEKTPELFEKFLPYAIALDVENEWGKKFESVLDKAIMEERYSPAWYSGNYLSVVGAGGLTESIGSSLTSSISSSSTAPGSSSGGSGGSSGGGGGGGGGGGW